jgi:hypothetical protein
MLAPDPCTLLDEVREADRGRFRKLAEDAAHGGRIRKWSECEARVALTLENRGFLSPLVSRADPGDFRDGDDVDWELKSPHSADAIRQQVLEAATRGGEELDAASVNVAAAYDRTKPETVERIVQRLLVGFNVIVDMRRLTADQADDLRSTLEADYRVELDRVVFFPDDLSPYRADA